MSGKKFSKSEIIDNIYENTGMNKQDIKFVFDSVFNTVKDALIGGFDVELRGFGTFEVRIRKGRKKARNPRTGEPVEALPHGIAVFKPGRELKREVWQLRAAQLTALQETDSQKDNAGQTPT